MGQIEQIAMIVVLTAFGIMAAIIKSLSTSKKIVQARLEMEAAKRAELEIKNEVNNKPIDDLIDDSNKRHGR